MIYRGIYCKQCGHTHDATKSWPHPLPETKRAALFAPQVISDVMPETQHPCNGKHYTSKSRFRAETRAHGCVEIGNEKQPDFRPPRPDRKAIELAVRAGVSKAGLGS